MKMGAAATRKLHGTAKKRIAKKPKRKKQLLARLVLVSHKQHVTTTTTTTTTRTVASTVTAKKSAAAAIGKSKTKAAIAKSKTKAAIAKRKTKAATEKSKRPAETAESNAGVYVLELEDGCVYVGKSSNIARRVQQHMEQQQGAPSGSFFGCASLACFAPLCCAAHVAECCGAAEELLSLHFFLHDALCFAACVVTACCPRRRGASFTKLHRPTGRLLKRMGTLEGDGDGPERDETLRWMHKLGVDKVRGWKFVRKGKLTAEEVAEVQANIRELFDLCRLCGKKGHFARWCPASGVKKRKDSHATKRPKALLSKSS